MSEIVPLFSQLVSATQHCHEHSVAHLDLKLENVLVVDVRRRRTRSPAMPPHASSARARPPHRHSTRSGARSPPHLPSRHAASGPRRAHRLWAGALLPSPDAAARAQPARLAHLHRAGTPPQHRRPTAAARRLLLRSHAPATALPQMKTSSPVSLTPDAQSRRTAHATPASASAGGASGVRKGRQRRLRRLQRRRLLARRRAPRAAGGAVPVVRHAPVRHRLRALLADALPARHHRRAGGCAPPSQWPTPPSLPPTHTR